jgi:recombination protein RecA
MAKKVQADEVITVDFAKLLKSVTGDIKKDFEISDFSERECQTFLSTGNPGINYAFSGRADGGFPEGLMSELFGQNSTGKTLLALMALAETQKKNGFAILIDTEFAFNPDWYKLIGGNPDTLLHFQPEYIEKVYAIIKRTVDAIRAKDQNVPITIAYDSVAASPSKKEFEGAEHDMGKRALEHGKGIRMLMGLCKTNNVTFIAINQLRKSIGVMFGPTEDTVGGMAWKYATSLRVYLRKGKQIKQKTAVGEKVIGIHGALKVEKSRLRSPFAKADFDIYFETGIDPVSGLFEVMINEEIIKPAVNEDGKVSKGWWQYKEEKFQKTNFARVYTRYPELLGGMTPKNIPEDTMIVSDGDDPEDSDGDLNDQADADM